MFLLVWITIESRRMPSVGLASAIAATRGPPVYPQNLTCYGQSGRVVQSCQTHLIWSLPPWFASELQQLLTWLRLSFQRPGRLHLATLAWMSAQFAVVALCECSDLPQACSELGVGKSTKRTWLRRTGLAAAFGFAEAAQTKTKSRSRLLGWIPLAPKFVQAKVR